MGRDHIVLVILMWHTILKTMEIKGKREWEIMCLLQLAGWWNLSEALSHLPSEMWWVYSTFPAWIPLPTAAVLFLPASFSEATKQQELWVFLGKPGILHDSKSWLSPWDYQGSFACALYRCLFHSAQYTQYQIKASPHIYAYISMYLHKYTIWSTYICIFLFSLFLISNFSFFLQSPYWPPLQSV